MIIVRSPLRVSLGGGGTDLPSYYEKHEGFVLAAAIDKYVYITIHETFDEGISLKYSKQEHVSNWQYVEHPIFRKALHLYGPDQPKLEVVSMSDIPAGTGLGSSGSFTVGLLRALHCLSHRTVERSDLAEQACHIEIDLLHEPIGKQDQYIAAYGGVTRFNFFTNGQVRVSALPTGRETLHNLEENLVLYFTGYTRSASDILRDQDKRSRSSNKNMLTNLHGVKQLGMAVETALIKGDLQEFGVLMHLHWMRKRVRTKGMSNSDIDQCYEFARNNGAIGGKLVGAGGGGFLMLYTEDKTRLRKAMQTTSFQEVRFRFDFDGCTVMRGY